VALRAILGPREQFLLLFGGIWALVGLGLGIGFVVGGGNPLDDLILRWRSEPVQAAPLRVTPTNSTVNGRPVSRIRFEFHDRGGTTRQADCITSDPELIARATRGSALPAHYDPRHPARARIDGAQRSLFGLFSLLPLGMGLIGVVILQRGLRGLARRRRLLAGGAAARGQVLAVATTNVSINRRRLIEIRYRFPSLRGEVEGRQRGFASPKVGSAVVVLYDMEDPELNLLAQPADFIR
jgi:hypothetical protein